MLLTLRTMVLALFLLGVAGCGSSPAPTATPTPPTPTPTPAAPTVTPTETAPQIVESVPSIITVGIDPAFEPFVFTQEGRLAGFDVDLLNAMAAEADFEVAYVVSSFGEIFDGLQQGRYDAAISAITVTDARRALVDFTAPYFESGKAPVSFYNPGQGIAIRTDNMTIIGPESLVEGMRVGVKSGTTGAEYAEENIGAEIVAFAESEPALEALAGGELDAVIVDISVIVGYIRNNPEAGIRITGGPVNEESYAIAVSKDKPAVLALLDAALVKVKESGAYDRIYNLWFGTP
ncbi:MAG: transporter substrate-binding domain-containing protein [Caldilinea sp.]